MGDKTDNERIFQEAHNEFLASLSADERARFPTYTSADNLISDIKAPNAFQNSHTSWTKTLNRFKEFGDKLQPYFEVMNITLQSHPEWTAIAFGAFRLVLQLASNYASFFVKLAELVEHVSQIMPQYEELLNIGQSQTSSMFRSSLRDFYVDLFEFFRSIARLFSQKSGKVRRTSAVITQLLWQPFDVRYGVFVKRVEYYSQLLQAEHRQLHLKKTMTSAEAQRTENTLAANFRHQASQYLDALPRIEAKWNAEEREDLIKQLQEWLEAPKFMDELEKSQDLREEGIPGSGKTVLAAATIQELAKPHPVSHVSTTVCFYFFSYSSNHKKTPASAYRSILAQVLSKYRDHPTVLDSFSFAQKTATGGQSKASTKVMLQLLQMVLQHVPDLFIVVDGVDEADDPDFFITKILSVCQSSNTKIVFFSRPNVEALRNMDIGQSITITSALVDDDLRTYLLPQVESLLTTRRLPAGCDKSHLLAYLISGANGMFLWAHLMIIYLNSPALVPAQRLAAIQSLHTPESLDDMFVRILRLIANKIREEQDLARQIFLWVAHGHTSLTASELQYIVKPRSRYTYRNQAFEEYANFENTVVMVCASLIQRSGQVYQFVHKSVLDFMSDASRCFKSLNHDDAAIVRRFVVPISESQCEITSICLDYLLFETPAQPLSGDLRLKAETHVLAGAFPFLRYAAIHWTYHLEETFTNELETLAARALMSSSGNKLLRTIGKFLSTQLVLMSWIESLYTFERSLTEVRKGFERMESWSRWIESSDSLKATLEHLEIPPRMFLFSQDLFAIHESWGDLLSNESHEIWHDITAFTPSQFLAQTKATSVNSMPASAPPGPGFSTKAFAHVSETSYDRGLTGVLSVWPSRSYEILWSDLKSGYAIDAISNQSTGWVARYEVWDHQGEKPSIKAQAQLDLDAAEIKCHLESFLVHVALTERSKTGKKQELSPLQWATSFPIAIGRDLRTLCVLKTVFRMSFAAQTPFGRETKASLSLRKVSIPLHVISSNSTTSESSRASCNGSFGPSGDPKAHLGLANSYKLTFGHESRFLLYEERMTINLRPGSGTTHAIAVFEVMDDGYVLTCRINGLHRGQGAETSFQHCSWHPQLPLILFQRRSLGKGAVTILWYIERGKDPESCLGMADSLPCKPYVGIEYLTFSACGTQVVIKYYGSLHTLPETLSLTSYFAYQHALQAHDTSTDRPLKRQKLQRYEDNINSLDTRSSALAAAKTSAGLSEIFSMKESTSDKVNYKANKWKRDVNLVQISDGMEVTRKLFALPNVAGADNLNIQVYASSEPSDGKVIATLDKTAEDFYTMNEPADVHFPMFIKKSVAAVGSAEKRDASGKLILEAGNQIDKPVRTITDASSDSNEIWDSFVQMPSTS